ncbi:metallophosphoesterase family protein [Octadecabacter sp. R77987]|uniref:metallophosphoesterase family protein n=1 Tax=Octadecabacter sp. R77987 TaxID=3093874 RepID=UPI00366E8BC7
MKPIYGVGDIHGYLDQLDHALALIEADGGPDAEIVFVGDYTDRGPDSRGVIQRLLDGVAAGRPWHVLRGNHDRMFTRFVRDGTAQDPMIKSGKGWLHTALGGPMTLQSYGALDGFDHPDGGGGDAVLRNGLDPIPAQSRTQLVSLAQTAVPEAHLEFLEQRPLMHVTDDLLFVHAGIRPGIPLAKQTEEDLIWIRDRWLDDPRDHGRLVVHGHTALDHPVHHGNRVNIDGGAGYGRALVPVVFEGRDVWTLTNIGRKPLVPE